MIQARIVADSICPRNHRLTSLLVTIPRFIAAELNTHRMLTKNAASSRAVPFDKMVKLVLDTPFIPIAWQKNHKGMQGKEYITDPVEIQRCEKLWLDARDSAVSIATSLNKDCDVTKQLCNRLLEPFMWHTVLVSATEWQNFFEQRCPRYQTSVSKTVGFCKSKQELMDNHSNPVNLDKLDAFSDLDWLGVNQGQAEIHMMAVAEAIYTAMNESTPNKLKIGEWHIPFTTLMDPDLDVYTKLKVATARCARTSYSNFDGEFTIEKDIALHDQLITDMHFSPLEHCAQVMTDEDYFWRVKGKFDVKHLPSDEDIRSGGIVDIDAINSVTDVFGWDANYRGYKQYRTFINENKNQQS